jgi:triphosphatase
MSQAVGQGVSGSFASHEGEAAVARDAGSRPVIDKLHPGAAADAELELKLMTDEQTLHAMLASPIWQKAARATTDRELSSVYFDQDDFSLIKSGITFRIRTAESGRILTVKSDKNGGSHALMRGEWEVSLPETPAKRENGARSTELLNLLPANLPAELAERLRSKELRPMVRTDVRRRTLELETATGIIEVSVDEGAIVVGRKRLPIAEIELELKSGSPEAIYLAALELAAEHAAHVSIHAKSARGFEVAMHQPPSFSKRQPVEFPKSVSLYNAFAIMLQSAFGDMLRNAPAARDGRDPEGLHQYRVALRRLRSLLSLMRRLVDGPTFEMLRAEAKALMSRLGKARDLDVFVTETWPRMSGAGVDSYGAADVSDAAEELRRKAHRDVVAALDDKRTTHFILNLGLWIERRGWLSEARHDAIDVLNGSAEDFGNRTVQALRDKAFKKGRGFRKLSPDARHQVRIAIKKLRYAYQFFQPLLKGSSKRKKFAKALANLQTALGEHNDRVVMNRLIHTVLETEPSAKAHLAAGFVLGRNAALLADDDEGLLKAWRRFKASN